MSTGFGEQSPVIYVKILAKSNPQKTIFLYVHRKFIHNIC